MFLDFLKLVKVLAYDEYAFSLVLGQKGLNDLLLADVGACDLVFFPFCSYGIYRPYFSSILQLQG